MSTVRGPPGLVLGVDCPRHGAGEDTAERGRPTTKEIPETRGKDTKQDLDKETGRISMIYGRCLPPAKLPQCQQELCS